MAAHLTVWLDSAETGGLLPANRTRQEIRAVDGLKEHGMTRIQLCDQAKTA